MIIKTHPRFDKNFRKRIAPNRNLATKFSLRLKIFSQNPQDPILKDHRLTGASRELRSFSITGDIRVVYRISSPNEIIFIDIGTHNQVY